MRSNNPKDSSFFEQLKIYCQSRYAPPVTRIEENTGSRLAVATITIISFIIFIFIVWTYLTPIEEIAVTVGEVIPKNKIYSIQNLDGGVIGNILVKEGDEVQTNQILVTFDPTIPKLELEQLRARNAALIANSKYLESLLEKEDKPYESSKQEDSTTPPAKAPNATDFNVNVLEPDKSISGVKEQAIDDLSKFESVIDILKKRLSILVQEKDMYETLLKTGSVSQKDYLMLLRTITQVQEDISKTQAARVETQYTIDKLQDRINRIEVRSPIHGLVKGLQIHIGNVIAPGGFLMNIVPIESLMVETKISAADIGHVKIGASVRIKVAAYDYTRYGTITGKLVNISAATFVDPQGKAPYYKGLVELEKSYVGDNSNRNRLLPGMTVQADINTGSKTLLQYLLRPIEVLISSSFREY